MVDDGPLVESITYELVVLHLVVNLRRINELAEPPGFEKLLDGKSMDIQAGDEYRTWGLYELTTYPVTNCSIYEHLEEARVQRRICYVLCICETKQQSTSPPSRICANPDEPSTYVTTEYDKIMQMPSYELGE